MSDQFNFSTIEVIDRLKQQQQQYSIADVVTIVLETVLFFVVSILITCILKHARSISRDSAQQCEHERLSVQYGGELHGCITQQDRIAGRVVGSGHDGSVVPRELV